MIIRPWKSVRLLAVMALVMALTGCAFLRGAIGMGPQKPRVRLTNIDVRRASPVLVELSLRLMVDNPNDFALKFSRLSYRMTSGTIVMAHGTHEGTLAVPPEGSAEIVLPLSLDPVQAFKVLQNVLTGTEEESFALLSATADFETPFGAMEVSFEDKKSLKKLAGF